jgi:hypothetical protein
MKSATGYAIPAVCRIRSIREGCSSISKVGWDGLSPVRTQGHKPKPRDHPTAIAYPVARFLGATWTFALAPGQREMLHYTVQQPG